MPVAHQPPAAIIGELVGMAAEQARNLGLHGLRQNRSVAQNLGQRIAKSPWLGTPTFRPCSAWNARHSNKDQCGRACGRQLTAYDGAGAYDREASNLKRPHWRRAERSHYGAPNLLRRPSDAVATSLEGHRSLGTFGQGDYGA
jgi:hypothetical protein